MDRLPADATIAIAGAGCIGCHVGGRLALGGRRVVLLGRPATADRLAVGGIGLSDAEGGSVRVPPTAFEASADPAVLAKASVVLVTVKSGATAEMATLVARHAREDAIVVSLQNGLDNAAAIACLAGGRRVVSGMVPYNVVEGATASFHRATGGEIVIGTGVPGLSALLDVPGLPVVEAADMEAILWGKLLLNLNNGLNALSGLPLREQLADRGWRMVLADAVAEALEVAAAAKIRPRLTMPLAPSLLPSLLRLPTPLFRLVAGRMLRIDAEARSSMFDDLAKRRVTEIGVLQGAVIERAERCGISTPVNRRIAVLVTAAERAGQGSPRLSSRAVFAV